MKAKDGNGIGRGLVTCSAFQVQAEGARLLGDWHLPVPNHLLDVQSCWITSWIYFTFLVRLQDPIGIVWSCLPTTPSRLHPSSVRGPHLMPRTLLALLVSLCWTQLRLLRIHNLLRLTPHPITDHGWRTTTLLSLPWSTSPWNPITIAEDSDCTNEMVQLCHLINSMLFLELPPTTCSFPPPIVGQLQHLPWIGVRLCSPSDSSWHSPHSKSESTPRFNQEYSGCFSVTNAQFTRIVRVASEEETDGCCRYPLDLNQ